ncbi:Vacuolar fusion protein MON1 [Cytospora mali]|uniref:Vacuolar fusion protein MON1 n=1 Tax=Cytospora mali TaxID=578113 RepID=A0A194VQ59_CYTMA|nr:Vacuolar fusion protein MON1 [Valsa mali]
MVQPDDGVGHNEPRDDSTGRALDAEDDRPPPLPPRRTSFQLDPGQLAKPTTALSSIDIQTLSFPDGSRGTFEAESQAAATASGSMATSRVPSGHVTPVELGGFVPGSALPGRGSDVADDSISIMSFSPTLRPPADLASLVTGELNKKSRAWAMLRSQSATVQPFQRAKHDATDGLGTFENEFEEIPGEETLNDEERLVLWRSKLKHYMILSSAGKPIWSRHGDLSLINSSMGVVQTIISFYEGMENPLQGFTAGNTRFVVSTEGPLYFVAISRLGESDVQLRDQLKALYMQILSTLTLPTLTKIFVHRPSTDLRTPLQGTESLLSSLADSFTKGSPSSMLGALECLKIRKSQRHTINNAFLKVRTEKLLYGLIVAGGKLVSVIRPRRHSLHPSDLQLIFNMLFESGGIKAGGGENWVPLCLPAFNSSGYLYMYVSFFDEALSDETMEPVPSPEEQIAIILISPDKESFYDLKEMRDKVADSLNKNGSLNIIKTAAKLGRPKVTDVAPGSQISHFLYKSRANVQFCMSTLEPFSGSPVTSHSSTAGDANEDVEESSNNDGLVSRRRLMTHYHQLHASVHARHSHLKVLHCVGQDATSLAWVTPIFEFYCVAGPNASRAVLTQGANKIIQWARKEEERIFIIGGGVF